MDNWDRVRTMKRRHLVVFFKRENKEFKKLIMRESRCIEVRRDRRDERGQYQ
jgi:hypothetical protein